MPDNDDRDSHEQPVRDSREAQIRHNWWSNAKDFILKMCRMYEVGHNAIFSEQHFTAHNQWILLLGAPSTSYTEQAEARGQPNDHLCSNRLLIATGYYQNLINIDIAKYQRPRTAMGLETKLLRLPLFRSRKVCGLSSCCFYPRPSELLRSAPTDE